MLLEQLDRPVSTQSSSASTYDIDLQRRVLTFFASRHWPALRRVEVDARTGVVTLRGQVASYYAKQLAYQFARHVAGVVQLVDDVIVQPAVIRPPLATTNRPQFVHLQRDVAMAAADCH